MDIINILHKRQPVANPYPILLNNGHILQIPWRRSRKAWHITIRISPAGETQVVIPDKCSSFLAAKFMDEKKGWIQKQLEIIEKRKLSHPSEKPKSLPDSLYLPLINETWQICFIPYPEPSGTTLSVDTLNRSIIIKGNDLASNPEWITLIEKWLKKKAKTILTGILMEKAAIVGVKPSRVCIRCQKTRWGSCSFNGTINLNAKLLVFPTHLANYIILHELCHIQHHNHGKRFWSMVEKYEPHFKAANREIREINSILPWWLT